MSRRALDKGATLGEVIVGLAIFALLTLAVVATLIQIANLDKKDTSLTETTFLVDSLLERRVSQAREYEEFDNLASTPEGDFCTLQSSRADKLESRYLYRVDVEQPMPGLKKVVVSIYHREEGSATPTIDVRKGQNGRAVSAGTMIGEPSR